MTQREEKSGAQRLFALLQHETHGVVDRRDMVCIEGVPQTKHIGGETQSHELRVLAGVMKIQAPTQQMKACDKSVKTRQAKPFRRRERRAGGQPVSWLSYI